MNRLISIAREGLVPFLLVVFALYVPVGRAEKEVSVYSLQSGETVTYVDQDQKMDISETYTLKKIKSKKDATLYEFSWELKRKGQSFSGGFTLNGDGCFSECTSMIQDMSEPGTILRFNASRKGTDIRVSSAWKDESGRGPKFTVIYNGIPEDTWVLMDGTSWLPMLVGLEPLAAGYSRTRPLVVLNPFSEDRRAGKVRFQVTGEGTMDHAGQAVPVYFVTMDVPMYVFTMKPEDQDKIGHISMSISKADRKMLKLDSGDLQTQLLLKP